MVTYNLEDDDRHWISFHDKHLLEYIGPDYKERLDKILDKFHAKAKWGPIPDHIHLERTGLEDDWLVAFLFETEEDLIHFLLLY